MARVSEAQLKVLRRLVEREVEGESLLDSGGGVVFWHSNMMRIDPRIFDNLKHKGLIECIKGWTGNTVGESPRYGITPAGREVVRAAETAGKSEES